jgi:hypothetical protein
MGDWVYFKDAYRIMAYLNSEVSREKAEMVRIFHELFFDDPYIICLGYLYNNETGEIKAIALFLEDALVELKNIEKWLKAFTEGID